MLTAQYPKRKIVFRNLGWDGDTVWAESRGVFDTPAKGYGRMLKRVGGIKPTVIFLGYGNNEAYAGKAGLPRFLKQYNKLLDDLKRVSAKDVRFVIIAPVVQMKMGPPLPDPSAYNAVVEVYTEALRRLASERNAAFGQFNPLVRLAEHALAGAKKEATGTTPEAIRDGWTHNGLHWRGVAYQSFQSMFAVKLLELQATWAVVAKGDGSLQATAGVFAEVSKSEDGIRIEVTPKEYQAGAFLISVRDVAPGTWELRHKGKVLARKTTDQKTVQFSFKSGPHFAHYEKLRQAIIAKNRLYFHSWRPQNITYLFLFRKHEQGNNAKEVKEFLALVAKKEQEIDRLKQPITRTYELVYPLAAAIVIALALVTQAAHAQRNLKNIPDPDPELERKSFIVPEGVEVNLFASDPRIAKPIQMNFDPQGRLWIASSSVYPHIKPGQKEVDRILVLEDKNGDGKADKTTVFADGLLIPTGVAPGDGGAYVANSTELLHFADTNGDGKADKKRVVLSGFGTEDTHHILHTLRWGPAGMLYMNQSIYIHSHIETPYGVKRLNAGGIWQFRPETLELSVYARGWVNAWGHQLDAYGQSFVTDGAGGQGINYAVPGAAYQTAFGAKRLLPGLNPGSPKYCGLEIVGGRHLPKSWQNNILTNDFRGNRVCRFVITEDGSGFAARQQEDVIKTKHIAFRPIDVKMGPDGAIYIADWYNPIIQHGEVDFRDPRRDHVHGRIWRVTFKGRKTLPKPKLVGATTAELLNALKSPEMWTRQQAKRVLKERGDAIVLPELAKWVESLDPADPLVERHRLEALWVYQSLRMVEPKLLKALLNAKDHRVRAAATRIIGHWASPIAPGRVAAGQQQLTPDTVLQLLAKRVADDHPRVRLEAVRVLGKLGRRQPGMYAKSVFSGAKCAAIAMRALDKPVDRFLDYAIWLTANELKSDWLPLVEQGKFDFDGNVGHLAFALKSVGTASVVRPLIDLFKAGRIPANRQQDVLAVVASLGGPAEMRIVYDAALAANSKPSRRVALLSALANAAGQRNVRPAGDVGSVLKLINSDDRAVRVAAIRCAGLWRVAAARPGLNVIAASDKEPLPIRLAALGAVGDLRGAASVRELIEFTKPKHRLEIRTRAAAELVAIDPNRAAPAAVDVLTSMKAGDDPAEIVSAFLQRRNGVGSLAARLKGKTINADVAKLALRTVSGSGRKYPGLESALSTAGRVQAKPKPLTPAQMEKLIAEVQTAGNPDRGEAVFRRRELNCLKCHSIGGSGGKAGPDLLSIGGSAQVDYLIDSLLLPNKKIKENYQTLVVSTLKGKVFTGIKVRQSDQDLILRDAEDREITIPLKTIDEQTNGKSMMPAGLTEKLTRRELVDLVSFLSKLGKVGRFSVGKARLVRTWQALADTPEARFKLRRTSYQSAAVDDPAFLWQPAYSQEGGIGIIHKNMSIEQQALAVDRVKRSEHGVIVDPVTLPPNATVGEAANIMDERNIGGVPITENGKLKGILTRRDLRFLESRDTRVEDVMTKDKLVTAHAETDLKEAQRILLENKVEKLLLVDEQYQLQGLITIKDIDKNLRFPLASKDGRGRLRVGAAVGVHDEERIAGLIAKGVDVLVVDSAHGNACVNPQPMHHAIELFAAINFTVIGLSHTFRHRAWAEFMESLHRQGRAGALANGLLPLLMGSLIVAFHNVWTGIPLILTLIGWAFLLKAGFAFLLPDRALRSMARLTPENSRVAIPAGVMMLAVAAALLFSVWQTRMS
eukprot:g21909.t1